MGRAPVPFKSLMPPSRTRTCECLHGAMEAVDGAAVCGCWANRQAKPGKPATSSRARRGSTIPYWLVIVIGLITIIGSILAAELWLARHGYADASDALAACLYFFLDAISAFAVTGTVTEVSVRLRMCLVDVRNVYFLRTRYGPPRLCRPPKGLAAARPRVCRGRACPLADWWQQHHLTLLPLLLSHRCPSAWWAGCAPTSCPCASLCRPTQ